ncbi:MAG: hypothetical protein CMM77_06775 [Rhodospirillaceae bacterium]|nr:hypothetical protein [Magnetovibrio sp.]MAY66814.1 hypothetical protein [Rhodospirillaceae bacterium]
MSIYPSFTALAVFLFAVAAHAAETPRQALPRAEMLEEDSHPHEVQPGREARFHTLPAATPSLLDVKCSLTGPAARAAIVTSGMELQDWPLPGREFDLAPGATLWLDITAVVNPGTTDAPYFAFRNLDASRLLWHQCYNN